MNYSNLFNKAKNKTFQNVLLLKWRYIFHSKIEKKTIHLSQNVKSLLFVCLKKYEYNYYLVFAYMVTIVFDICAIFCL